MFRFKKISTLLFLLLAFASCKKWRYKTEVSGVVRDITNSNSIANVTVFLVSKNIDCFTCGYSTIDKSTSDVNGTYSFSFTGEKGYSYGVAAEADKYFETINPVDIKKGEKNKNTTIYLQPEAYLSLYIKNVSGSEQISLSSPCNVGCIFSGNVDTFQTYRVKGNANNIVIWFVYKNSIGTRYENYIYCPALDTAYYTINY